MRLIMDAKEVSQLLADKALSVSEYLLPNGRKNGNEWCCGSINGEEGQSLKVHLSGSKAGVWKDFSDQDKGGDLLDLWAACRGLSFVDALKDACKWLGVEFSPKFSVAGKKSFTRPSVRLGEVIQPKEDGYFDRRRINGSTLKAYCVANHDREIAFPLMVEGVIYNIKYLTPRRKGDEKNRWRQESNCEPCLFGWQVISPDDDKVVITEGEIDALSVFQSGVKALSMPSGAKNLEWIEYDWERLQQFRVIYLALDNDDPGQLATMEVLRRLGEHRCKLVDWGDFKDANECLCKAGEAAVLDAIVSAKYTKPEDLKNAIEYADILFQDFNGLLEAAAGNTTPFAGMKDFKFGMDQLTVWTGYSGHGKSQLLGYCMCEMILRQKERICLFSGEMKPYKVLNRMVRQVCGKQRPDTADLTEALNLLSGGMNISGERCTEENGNESGGLWIYDINGAASLERMLNVFKYAKQRYNCRHFVIDSLMMLGVAESDVDRQKKIAEMLRDFKSQNNIHIHLVAHPRKPDNGDESKPPNKHDVRGSAGITDLADNVLVVWRNSDATGYGTDPDAKLICQKQRDSGYQPMVNLFFDHESCQYHEHGREAISMITGERVRRDFKPHHVR
jgi:twinkle protein